MQLEFMILIMFSYSMIFTRFNNVDIMFNNIKSEIKIHFNTTISIVNIYQKMLQQRNIDDRLFKKVTAKDLKKIVNNFFNSKFLILN